MNSNVNMTYKAWQSSDSSSKLYTEQASDLNREDNH